MALAGILLNFAGSLVLIFTPMEVAYGGPVIPSKRRWRTGWALILVGYGFQAAAACSIGR